MSLCLICDNCGERGEGLEKLLVHSASDEQIEYFGQFRKPPGWSFSKAAVAKGWTKITFCGRCTSDERRHKELITVLKEGL